MAESIIFPVSPLHIRLNKEVSLSIIEIIKRKMKRKRERKRKMKKKR